MVKVIAVASWIVTVLIAVLGVTVGQAIWFYQEPFIAALAQPASYTAAVIAGIAALVGSATVSILATAAVLVDR